MNEDYFARLDAELRARTRSGEHLAVRRRMPSRVARRALGTLALVVVLASCLVSEFPASAGGHPVGPATRLPTAAIAARGA